MAVAYASHTPTQSACIASAPAVPLFCSLYTPIAAPPSSSFLPFCGRRALFDHRIRIVCGHIDVFLERPRRPNGEGVSVSLTSVLRQHSVEIIDELLTYLAGFVLRDLVLSVLLAVLALTVGATRFRDVNLQSHLVSEDYR